MVRPNKFVSRGTAPIAISDDLQQFVHFGQGSKDSSLRVHMCIPLFNVNSNYYTTSLLRGGLSTSSIDSFPYIDLTAIQGIYAGGGSDMVKTYSNRVLGDIGSAFTRYRVLKCKFIYEPQSPTTVSDRLVFAFAADPEHPLIKNTPGTSSQTKLLGLTESVAFAPWRAWELDVTSSIRDAGKEALYTYNQDTAEYDNRFMAFGAIGCVPSVEPIVATPMTVYGVLYAELVFEFIEMDPINTTDPTFFNPKPRVLKALAEAGWSKKCSDVDCKACSKVCSHKQVCKQSSGKTQKCSSTSSDD